MIRAVRAASLVVLAALAWPAHADAALDALGRLSAAMHQLEYRGVMVYIRGNQIQALEVERRFDAGAPVDRVRTLTGELREWRRAGATVECTLGLGEMRLAEALAAPWPRLLAEPLDALPDVYRLSVTGEARVADVIADVLDAIPRDDARFGYRLWIARDSGLLLGSALVSPEGELLEQSIFAHVSVVGRDRSAREDRVALPGAAALRPWRIGALPPGFVLLAASDSDDGTRQFLFSDGLASLSLYVGEGPPTLVGAAARATTFAYGLALGTHHVVAIGELPPAAVERIARSVERLN